MYTIFRGGYNARHPEPFILSRPNGVDRYVILHVKTPAHFQIGEDIFDIMSNNAIIIRPNTPYQYSALSSEYKNDYMHFSCDRNLFEKNYGHLLHRPIHLQNPLQFTQYFQHIIWEYSYAAEDYKQQNLDMLFQIMLNKLMQEDQASLLAKNYNPYASRLQDLRLMMQSQPYKNFTPAELADILNVSTSHFQFLYKNFFGVPYKKDLIDMRLNYARDLILNTTLTLEQVAFMSGYSNEVHFFRQFKAKTGMTPREYQMTMKPKNIL